MDRMFVFALYDSCSKTLLICLDDSMGKISGQKGVNQKLEYFWACQQRSRLIKAPGSGDGSAGMQPFRACRLGPPTQDCHPEHSQPHTDGGLGGVPRLQLASSPSLRND